MKDIKRYYRENANRFGWGPKTARLDPERIALLNKYVAGKKVLDIGCGTGIYVDYLAKKGFEATGVDFVKEFIDFAKKHYQGKFLAADAYKLPFKNKSFDTVIMFDVLEHIENEELFLKNIKKICKQRIILIVPRKTDKKLELLGLIFWHYIDNSHVRAFTRKKINTLLKKLRIKIIFISFLNKIPIESLLNLIFINGGLFKKVIIKIFMWLFKTINFYSDIVIVGEIL